MADVICSWCQRKLGEKADTETTHTICPDCKEKQLKLLEELIKQQGDQNESDD